MFKLLITTIVDASPGKDGVFATSVVVEFATKAEADTAKNSVLERRQITSNAIQIVTALY